MERTYKTWGEKHNIFENDLCEVSVLYLNPMRRCSWHKHQAKYNLFYCLKGTLYIKVADGTAKVAQGQIFTTNPGEMHEFQTGEDGALVIEVMYVKYDRNDIERQILGSEMEKPIGDPEKCAELDTWCEPIIDQGEERAVKVKMVSTRRCDRCASRTEHNAIYTGPVESPSVEHHYRCNECGLLMTERED